MKLIIGLGNPGREYAEDRHNTGFMTVDRLAARLRVRFNQKRAQSQVATAAVDGERIALAKPQTYMNLSGESVRRLMAELGAKLEDVLVVYDDVDLPLGTLRLRRQGSPGTHNGMRSIVQALGTQGFARLRLGIGAPEGRQDLRDYVLGPFGATERPLADEMLDRAVEAVLTFVRQGAAEAMNRYNG